ncbi:hypothetical protein EJB05_25203 [Eragrostis curvula]|uniref:Uncharacterized protein n=1 Tax=Eragrostis curvula TaxID=38414 RepID=A0A5J9VCH6_9POAL|nr:hypothetical protein EJB05_25203 [Eragrostis curvula]
MATSPELLPPLIRMTIKPLALLGGGIRHLEDGELGGASTSSVPDGDPLALIQRRTPTSRGDPWPFSVAERQERQETFVGCPLAVVAAGDAPALGGGRLLYLLWCSGPSTTHNADAELSIGHEVLDKMLKPLSALPS